MNESVNYNRFIAYFFLALGFIVSFEGITSIITVTNTATLVLYIVVQITWAFFALAFIGLALASLIPR